MSEGSWTDEPRDEREEESPRRRPLPRVEDLPAAGDGYDRAAVEAAFAAFYRHAAEVDATLSVLEAVEAFQKQSSELRGEIRALRAASWGPIQARHGAHSAYAPRSAPPRAPVLEVMPRIAVEAAFIILVGVGAALAGLGPTGVILLVLAAWLVVALGEAMAAVARPAAPRPQLSAPHAAAAAPTADAPRPEPAPTQIVPPDELEAVAVEPEPAEEPEPVAAAAEPVTQEPVAAEPVAVVEAEPVGGTDEVEVEVEPTEREPLVEAVAAEREQDLEPGAVAEPIPDAEAAAEYEPFTVAEDEPAAAGAEEPLAEEPFAEAPADEEPADEEPAEEPLAEEPLAEEPFAEEPADEEPEPLEVDAAAEPAAEEPAPGDRGDEEAAAEAAPAPEEAKPRPGFWQRVFGAPPERAPEPEAAGPPSHVRVVPAPDDAVDVDPWEQAPGAAAEAYGAVDEAAVPEEPEPAVESALAGEREPGEEAAPPGADEPEPAVEAEAEEPEWTAGGVPAVDTDAAAVAPVAEDDGAPVDEHRLEEEAAEVLSPEPSAAEAPELRDDVQPEPSPDDEGEVEPEAEAQPQPEPAAEAPPEQEADGAAPEEHPAAEPPPVAVPESRGAGRWRFWRRPERPVEEEPTRPEPPQHVRLVDVEEVVVPEQADVPWEAEPADDAALQWGLVEEPEDRADAAAEEGPQQPEEERAGASAPLRRPPLPQRRRGRR